MWFWQRVVIHEHRWQLQQVKAKLVMFTGDQWYHVQVYHKWFFKWILQRDLIYKTYNEAKNEQIRLFVKYMGMGKIIN